MRFGHVKIAGKFGLERLLTLLLGWGLMRSLCSRRERMSGYSLCVGTVPNLHSGHKLSLMAHTGLVRPTRLHFALVVNHG